MMKKVVVMEIEEDDDEDEDALRTNNGDVDVVHSNGWYHGTFYYPRRDGH